MKKITTLIVLLTFSLGHSQSLPLDFTDPLDAMTGYAGSVCSVVLDAGNPAGQIVGGTEFYDTAQLVLAQNLNLADNANNTITFRFKAAAATGVRNHLLKFEGGVGGPATTELPFTSSGTGAWETITLNFGSGLGNYSLVVLFTDFATNGTGTYLIDDIAGGTNIAPPPPLATPSTAAPVPTFNSADVISMYGETYPNTYQYSFGSVAGEPDLDPTAAINLALKYDFAVAGYGAGYTQTDISSMGYVHFDYWTPNATNFGLYLISAGPTAEKIYNLPAQEAIVQNTWRSVTIPLSFFTTGAAPINPLTWFQFKFDVSAASPGTVYIDNVYFSKTALGVNDFEISKINMYPNPAKNELNIDSASDIENVSIFNLLGQEVISKSINNKSVSLNISDLQSGVYIVKTSIENKTSTSKFIKN
jgi:Secretion system C-terminal sorting domain